jgi:DNA-binding response OmpR family regulator
MLQETRTRSGGEAQLATAGVGAAEAGSRQRVLVVEDDPHDQEIYGRLLWYNGFDVIFAADGQSGLDAALETDPDLILLDLELPRLHGIELCRRLRAEPSFAHKPIIALSAHTRRRFGDRVADAGCDLFLEKPASPLEVLREVESRIGRPPLAGE